MSGTFIFDQELKLVNTKGLSPDVVFFNTYVEGNTDKSVVYSDDDYKIVNTEDLMAIPPKKTGWLEIHFSELEVQGMDEDEQKEYVRNFLLTNNSSRWAVIFE